MEQRITRAKNKIAGAGVAFETPSAAERAERGAVAAMLYRVQRRIPRPPKAGAGRRDEAPG